MAILSPALDPAQPTGLLLDGAFAPSGDDLDVVNPYTGETIATVAVGGPAEVDSAVAGALRHLPPPPAAERAAVLERAARLVAERGETFARTICLEAGKPMKQARGEADLLAHLKTIPGGVLTLKLPPVESADPIDLARQIREMLTGAPSPTLTSTVNSLA